MERTQRSLAADREKFIADRNNITRVWMDHAFWPFVTTRLYLDQTGDMEVLFEKVSEFLKICSL